MSSYSNKQKVIIQQSTEPIKIKYKKKDVDYNVGYLRMELKREGETEDTHFG